MARASGSTSFANTIIGSSLASTAALPPSHSFLRTVMSASLVPATSRLATCSGDSLPSSFFTTGSSLPSISRVLVSPNRRRSISSSVWMGAAENRPCLSAGSDESRYSFSRFSLGLASSSGPRTSLRAMANRSPPPARPPASR